MSFGEGIKSCGLKGGIYSFPLCLCLQIIWKQVPASEPKWKQWSFYKHSKQNYIIIFSNAKLFLYLLTQDPSDFQAAFDECIQYTSSADNWEQIKEELAGRGVRLIFWELGNERFLFSFECFWPGLLWTRKWIPGRKLLPSDVVGNKSQKPRKKLCGCQILFSSPPVI